MSTRNVAVEAGRLLRTVRELQGLSQARLAARAGVSQQRLSKVERGAVDPRVGELQRLFEGAQRRLRFETVELAAEAATDPDLALDQIDEDRDAMVSGFGYLLGKLAGVPHLVGGRMAALAHGLPVQVRRLDLIVAHGDRGRFAAGLARFNAVRWSERWQEYRDHTAADRPGPMRWLIGPAWELRVALVDEPPPALPLRIGDLHLFAPPLPWLLDHDPDVAALADQLRAAGWARSDSFEAGAGQA